MSKVFEIVTARILEMLKKGVIPWRRPWKGVAPQNLITRKSYRGINAFILAFSGSSYFLTFNQARAIGAHIKKGAKGLPVVFWKFNEYKKAEAKAPEETEKNTSRPAPILRYYTVFRMEDVAGIPQNKLPEILQGQISEPIAEAERIVDKMLNKPLINFGGNIAFYQPSTDSVTVPVKELFGKIEEFYSTLFHELAHSTGHASRLARKSLESYAPFGSDDYSREELVAEMGAGFLCAACGIDNSTIDNSVAYIDNWMKAIRADDKAVIIAAGQAQKAVDYILGANSAEAADQED
jgi:antirestriction protein ArdC